MADSPETSRKTLLTIGCVREWVRAARGGFAPDHVARELRNGELEPAEDSAAELAELLGGLAATARERIEAAGIEPHFSDTPAAQKLTTREREFVANLGALLAGLAMARVVAGKPDEAITAAREGVAWSRVADDLRQQTIQWRVLASVYERIGNVAEQERATDHEVETARASGDHEQLVQALIHHGTFLAPRWRADEAARATAEAEALLNEKLPDDVRNKYYAALLLVKARISVERTQFVEAVRLLREGLHHATCEEQPITRTAILGRLGSMYLKLAQYQQCIECQHEMVRCAEAMGSTMIRGWGYLRIADAHMHLKEYDKTLEMLDRADECTPNGLPKLACAIAAKRARVLLVTQRAHEAAELCRGIIADIGDGSLAGAGLSAWMTLAKAEEGLGRYEAAEQCYRRTAERVAADFPQFLPKVLVNLASTLHLMGHSDQAAATLDEVKELHTLSESERILAVRLRGGIAEHRGDLRAVIEYEREAADLERALLERQAEQSLRNARIMAETDLLEREADLERERRRRVERELADAIVELSDRKRQVENVQQQLRGALAKAGFGDDESSTTALREALVSLRGGQKKGESPLHYLSSIDEEFFNRLRKRCPDLTPKQERLCGLIRAGLASKEIASLLDLAPEGLKAQRKRLRKKLGLDVDDSLEKTLSEL